MLLGVLVAMIVVFTLWARQPFSYPISQEPAVVTKVKKLKEATVKNYVNAFEVLHSGQNNPY
jgi:hypothetical protein